MGFLKFVMKRGIGSPGSIAKAMAKTYAGLKRESAETKSESDVLRQLYLGRVSAAAAWNKAAQFGYSTEPSHVEQVLSKNPDLANLVKHVVVSEHPELLDSAMSGNPWEVLDEVVEEMLDRHAPGWRR